MSTYIINAYISIYIYIMWLTVQAYKSKKKTKKTIQEKINNEEQGINGGGRNRVSCSSYSSDDESNAKTRATRGSATDPQSLYARVRSYIT